MPSTLACSASASDCPAKSRRRRAASSESMSPGSFAATFGETERMPNLTSVAASEMSMIAFSFSRTKKTRLASRRRA